MNAMTEIKPMFEVGKRYRLRNGMETAPLRRRLQLHSVYPFAAEVNGLTEQLTWTEHGDYSASGAHQVFDLMPGAIEDEPKATPAAPPSAIDGLRKDLAAQASVIAGMAAKIEVQEGTIANLNQKIDDGDGENGERLDLLHQNLTGLSYITANHASQIEQLRTHSVSDRRQTDERLDRFAIELSGKVNARTESKPIIKGGWVGIYRGDAGYASVGSFVADTYEECAAKTPGAIARIQIRDITEAEGL